uniref:tRNA wybutosine-synthesizing protein 3 homolog n=1 Tax=Lygus hesperus TaxID=30085 RepID=A0A0A9Y1U0_LYGHE
MNGKSFSNFKKQVLHCPDASKKGDIDEHVQDVINNINASDKYVTLSSCSGRTAVLLQCSEIEKEGCQWVYCTHDFVDDSALIRSILSSASQGDLTLKFEPFILHVACQTLEDAKLLLTCALNAGCKNSGITLGKHGRLTVAARNTLSMEVPLASKGNLLVSEEFIKFLATQANEKMTKNLKKLAKFEKCIAELLNG